MNDTVADVEGLLSKNGYNLAGSLMLSVRQWWWTSNDYYTYHYDHDYTTTATNTTGVPKPLQ